MNYRFFGNFSSTSEFSKNGGSASGSPKGWPSDDHDFPCPDDDWLIFGVPWSVFYQFYPWFQEKNIPPISAFCYSIVRPLIVFRNSVGSHSDIHNGKDTYTVSHAWFCLEFQVPKSCCLWRSKVSAHGHKPKIQTVKPWSGDPIKPNV